MRLPCREPMAEAPHRPEPTRWFPHQPDFRRALKGRFPARKFLCGLDPRDVD
ncbi:GL11927 [Drosophila persimilis]|uniref:GL11927 n=1 Tax=Drosophila persimilis TaxID=7234 RepID=B4HDP1_DROPE|nr:GL11927 [Drosophila persimilis]